MRSNLGWGKVSGLFSLAQSAVHDFFLTFSSSLLLSQELSKDETLPKKQRLLLEEHEPQIRMQLARNLAQALMSEGNEQ